MPMVMGNRKYDEHGVWERQPAGGEEPGVVVWALVQPSQKYQEQREQAEIARRIQHELRKEQLREEREAEFEQWLEKRNRRLAQEQSSGS